MLYFEEISPSGFPQQQQPRRRSYRPWGCCPRPGSPSFPRQIRLTAALCLRRRDFWRRNPDLSQNKKHITWKQYVVLSFLGSILSHQLFTKQDLWTKLNISPSSFINYYQRPSSHHQPFIKTQKTFWKKEEKRFRDRKGIGYLLRYNMAIKSEGNKDKNLSQTTKK